MIGMMYLVLMALLALNVSKEVLDAFVIVDHGIVKTTENFTTKNDIYYEQFDQAAAENPVKAGPWKAKADEVKKQANELYNFLQELKIEIVHAVDGEDSEAVDEENHIDGEKIKAKDDNSKPAEIMIGANMDGKANDLRSAIEAFRGYLLSIVDTQAAEVISSIQTSLNTDDPPFSEKEGQLTWQEEHFEHYPMIAVITLMSKMQSDVRNAESDAIRYLYSQIEAGSFKFNYLESVVQSESNYVIRGADYSAEVFIAARDTTQLPIIYMGVYDSTINDDGTVEYKMRGELGVDYDTLPIRGGRGVYSVKTSSTGPKSWGGLIALKRMDGSFTRRPFHAEYTVATPALIVSPTKMNVFYQALENPVEVSAPGTPRENLVVRVNNGTIRGSNGSYTVIPTRTTGCDVTVYDNSSGSNRSLGTIPFRVDPVPPPQATVANKSYGTVLKTDIQRVLGIEVSMPEWFKFDVEYKITAYTYVNKVGVNIQKLYATNGDFTSQIRNAINATPSGQYLTFEDIKVVGPDGSEQSLPNLSVQLR